MANDSIPLKQCSRKGICLHPDGSWLPATPEYFSPTKRGTLYSICKKCKSWDVKERRQKDPERAKQIATRSRIKHRDKRNANTRDWFARHPGYKREWERNNPEKVRVYKQRTRENHKAEISRYNSIYYQKNKPAIQKRHKDWQSNNRPLLTIKDANRRAKMRSLPSGLTKTDWGRCLEYWNGRCCVCGRLPDFWHIIVREHWIAVDDKRTDNPGNVVTNILPMCHSIEGVPSGDPGCNQSKWKHDPIDWLNRKLGKRKAAKKIAEIYAYFEWAKSHKDDDT